MSNPPAVGPSLIVLFPQSVEIEPEGLAVALRAYDDSLAEVECGPGFARWGSHTIRILPISAPVPASVMDTCLKPAHLSPELKDVAYQQRGHALLFPEGSTNDPFEDHVAMTAVAAALVRFDASFVLNENAHAAVPIGMLLPDPDQPHENMMAYLRELPIPLLYGGFVKMEVEGELGVWMRTYGNPSLNLPNLAMHVPGHDHGNRTFALFANMLAYLRESGARFGAGHTMQVGPETYLRLREPLPEEWFLESDGPMFVAETIDGDAINLLPR